MGKPRSFSCLVILTPLLSECGMSEPQAPRLMPRTRRWQHNPQTQIHLFTPYEVSPGVIRNIDRTILLPRPPVAVRNPLCLFGPEISGNRGKSTRHDCNQKELRPGLNHRLPHRNRPGVLIETGRVQQFMNEDSCCFLFPIDKDAIRRTGHRVAPIHMLRPQVLANTWKSASSLCSKPIDSPRLSIGRLCEPLKDAAPDHQRNLRRFWQKSDYAGQVTTFEAHESHFPRLIRIPHGPFQARTVELCTRRGLSFCNGQLGLRGLRQTPLGCRLLPQKFCAVDQLAEYEWQRRPCLLGRRHLTVG